MSIERPTHFTARTLQGDGFGEALQIIRTAGAYDGTGEWTATESPPVDTHGATAPGAGQGDNPRVRVLLDGGGVRLDDVRLFWMVESLDPVRPPCGDDPGSFGDIVVFAGERYRVRGTARWDGFSETVGVRIEGQTPA